MEYEVDNIHRDLPTINVNVTMLDNLLKSKKEITTIDFIKVDIERTEYAFLPGARKNIDLFNPAVRSCHGTIWAG